MIKNIVKYSYNDVTLEPARISSVSSRSECCPYDENGMLPIFTAPMSTVVDTNNFAKFENNKIYCILPRNIDLEIRLGFAKNGLWAAFSLQEFENHFIGLEYSKDKTYKVLIDIANGHMKKLYNKVAECKETLGNSIKIMVGNIANPETYEDVFLSGADYVRVGIGSGAGCITSSNTAIHYPMASLISEMADVKRKVAESYDIDMEYMPKIIADGGIRNFSDVIKAIALGADYVMVGGLFASFLESASPIMHELGSGWNGEMEGHEDEIEIHNGITFFRGNKYLPLKKRFYGMASKAGQTAISGEATKTAEGIERIVEVKYRINGWVDNMTHYLKSAMSYSDATTLDELRKKSQVVVISNNTCSSVNK